MKASRPLLIIIIASCAALLFAADSSERLLREGNARFERGDYPGAAERYRDLVRLYPGSDEYPEALYRFGISRIKSDAYAEGVELLERLEARYPGGRFHASFWIGYGKNRLGLKEEALSAWERYLAGNLGLYRNEARLLAAYVAVDLDRSERAEELLQRLATDDKEFFAVEGGLVLLGELYRLAGRYEELVALAEEYKGDSPPPRFNLALGEAYAELGRLDAAEAAYRATAQNGNEADRATAFGRLFSLFEGEERFSAMEELMLEAEESLDGNREALAAFWYRVGAVLGRGDNPTRGISYLSRAWRLRNEVALPAALPLFLAQALHQNGDAEAGIAILETALEEEYGTPERIRYRLAALEASRENWNRTAEVLEESESLDDAAAALLGSAYLKLRLYAQGLSAVDRGLGFEDISSRWELRLLELRWRLLAALGRPGEAADQLAEYRRLGGRAGTVLERARLSYNAGRYREALDLLKAEEELPAVKLLQGLSFIALEEYGAAEERLGGVDSTQLAADEAPLALYYLAWSRYRRGDYRAALRDFTQFLGSYPDHDRTRDAAFYGAWSAFSLEEYLRAAELFAAYGSGGKRSNAALLARARALAAAGKGPEAILIAEEYLKGGIGANEKDQALYLIFRIRLEADDFSGSAAALSRLGREYPGSSWRGRALYHQGRALLTAGRPEEAAGYLDRYRTAYSGGEFAPEALYYRAEAAVNMGEGRLAVLLWARLNREYPESPLRAEALFKRGSQLEELGQYADALETYGLLLKDFPARAERLGVGAAVERLESLLIAADSSYWDLIRNAEEAGGVANTGGRELMREAIRRAMAEGRAEEFTDAGRRIDDLISYRNQDDREEAENLYLAGEYRFRRNEYGRAASFYLQAGSVMPGNPDFTAQALYRAALMTRYAGDDRGYSEILRQMRGAFPGSSWLEAAEELQDEDFRGASSLSGEAR